MKHSRIISVLLAAVLLFGVLCAACGKQPAEPEPGEAPTTKPAPTEVPTESPTETPEPFPAETPEPVPAESPEPDDGIPVRLKNGGRLSFLDPERIEIPPLSEMVYARPDFAALNADLDALTQKAAVCTDADELLNDWYTVFPRYQSAVSMCSLAFFRYTMDCADDTFAKEYDYCDEQGTITEEKLFALYAAFADSPCRDALEQAYFGEGFFKDYDAFNTADDAFYALLQQENDLLFRYYALTGAANLSSREEIKQNHDAVGELFLELVKVRQQIAAAKGYENYMDYRYAVEYGRDYTTAQAREYLTLVQTDLAPMTQNSAVTGYESEYGFWNESKAMEYLESAAEKMGGPILEAFRFMTGHTLYDISYAPNKMGIAYTSYLDDYEAPFVFVNPDAKDLLIALFHEYGHFTDYYRNYGIAGDYETGETYSQAMVYLAFAYADPFNDSQRQKNLRATVSQLLIYSVLQEGVYADFELQVYALPVEELTLERLDEIFAQCMKDYGLRRVDGVGSDGFYWIAYNHFFAYPGYVISYSVSAIAALEICRLEAEEPGAGVDAFCRLLNRTHGKKFTAVLEEAGLSDPFEASSVEKTAMFLRETFGMN